MSDLRGEPGNSPLVPAGLGALTDAQVPYPCARCAQDRRYYNEIELSDLVQPGSHEDRIALTLSDRAGSAASAGATAARKGDPAAGEAGAGGDGDDDDEDDAGNNSLQKRFEKAERVKRVVRGVADEWDGRLAEVSFGVPLSLLGMLLETKDVPCRARDCVCAGARGEKEPLTTNLRVLRRPWAVRSRLCRDSRFDARHDLLARRACGTDSQDCGR